MNNFLFLFFFWMVFPVFSQKETVNEDVMATDSTDQHSVKKAVIFSAVIPGAGQVYNHIAMPKGKKKAYWKVPLIYAGLGATTYYAFKSNTEQKELKQEYLNRTNLGIQSDKYENYDDTGILQLYQQKLNNRDLLFLGMGLVYLIQIADAAVEAHFVNFDITDDLSMKVRPAFIPLSYRSPVTVGVSLQFNLK